MNLLSNFSPVVSVGTNQTITLPAAATLLGGASDDGLPTNSALTTNWNQLSKPGTVTFANPAAPATTCHCRVRSNDATGSPLSQDQAFTTLEPP